MMAGVEEDPRLPVPVNPYGVYAGLGWDVHYYLRDGRYYDALALADANEAIAGLLGDEGIKLMIRQGRAYALLALGRLNEALVVVEELAESRRPLGPRSSYAKCIADLAELLIKLGRIDEGLHWLARANAVLSLAPHNGIRYFSALTSVGDAAQAADLYELAHDCFRQAEASFAEDDLFTIAGQLQHAEMLVEWAMRLEQVGRIHEARMRYDRSVTMTTKQLSRHLESPLALALLALSLARTGRTDDALTLIDSALLPIRAARQDHEARLLHLAHSAVLRARGDLTGAFRELTAAEQLSEHSGHSLINGYELATLAAEMSPGPAARTMLAVLGQQVGYLWRQRLDRRMMLQQAGRRAELETANEHAEGAAASDALTGLGNRRTFDRRLAAVTSGTTLILIDVDKFKLINDTYSHSIGDQVLRTVAEILAAHCRAGESAVRFGGDEFAMFLQADLMAVTRIAGRIRQVIGDHDWQAVAPGLRVTLSIGAAAYDDDMTAEELMKRADHQLYEAKRLGRDRLAA
jgi:diguanylate cyclase